jgi:hypothetical protein
VSCIEQYVEGIGQIYGDYFERLAISSTVDGLIEVWERGIRPYWKLYVEEHSRRFEIECPCPSDMKEHFAYEYQREADQILKDFSGTWRVRVEEARSSEMVRGIKEQKAGRRNVGRPPGQTDAVRKLDSRIRKIKRGFSTDSPELTRFQIAQKVCTVLDNDRIPVYAAMQRKGLNSWTAALRSKEERAAIMRRIARV